MKITMNLRKFLSRPSFWNRPRIICADGFSLSVQASDFHYCVPQDSYGPWTHVEIGFPSDIPEGIMEYAEKPENPTETVYKRVPIELVEALIEKHGGFQC